MPFGGDIPGILQKLPYLHRMGVETLYFNPIFEAAENHRYGTASYENVDPMLGTNEDFTHLCDEAHKLGMKTTGNAGGSHNLTLTSRLTQSGDDLDAMLRKLGTGLFVVELMGQGVNYVTGDYSRGASGFWVENGRIAFPVQEITIAGNLKDMLMGIEAVGADAYNYGAKTVGSVLVNRMKVAGS